MLNVRCEMTVIDVNGEVAKKGDLRRLVLTSYETNGCGEGEYVTLHLPGGGSATVLASDLRAAVSTTPDDEFPF